MKLKYFYTLVVVVVTALVGCSDIDSMSYLGEVKVSQSYVAIPAGGGTVSVDVNAVSDWTITEVPEWLTLSALSGGPGETRITFSADGATATREASINLNCAGATQIINIVQMTEKTDLPVSTCAEVIAGADGKTFRVKGVCTAIANTTYGNWYINDGTGDVYIYGTVNASGAYAWASFGIEVGDEVTVEGPKTTYNGVVELVDATFIGIEKSLIKVDSVSLGDAPLPIDGGEFSVALTCKGNGVSVVIPEDAKSWLSVTAINTAGTTATITFNAAANAAGDRSTTLVFKTTDGKKDYSSETTISQKGSIIEVSIAEFNAAEVGETIYRLSGVVSEIRDGEKGRFYLKDYSGDTYVYNLSEFADAAIKVGDIVTVTGKRDEYNGTIEMTSAELEDVKHVTEVSIADFLTQGDSKDVYYMVTGTITSVSGPEYGNLYITDGENELYVYGCYPGYGATGDAKKNFLEAAGIKVGDKLTMIGYKDTYNGVVELCGGIYFAHESAE